MSSSKRLCAVLVLIGINLIFAIQGVSLATGDIRIANSGITITASSVFSVLDGAVLAKTIILQPKIAATEPKLVRAVITAYSSSVDETDDTPFITASGSIVRSGVAASSFLPFGTKFRIPKVFGEKVFVVEDKMNSRYQGSKIVDIWFQTKDEAQGFGRQLAQLEII